MSVAKGDKSTMRPGASFDLSGASTPKRDRLWPLRAGREGVSGGLIEAL
jgi:hypothetical protein